MTMTLKKRCFSPHNAFLLMLNSIHQSQGITMENVIIDAGDKELQIGLT